MAADDRIGQVDVFNDGLEFAPVVFGDLAAKDNSDLVGLTDGPIGIQEPFSELIKRRAPAKD